MISRLWQRFWDRAPRQLRFTRAGRILVVIAFAAGLAAMNTGNNLLFFGWGMVLSAIIVSGVLSEFTLRILSGDVGMPQEVRVGTLAPLPVSVSNRSGRLPAFAVEAEVELRDAQGVLQAFAPYQLRIAPAQHMSLYAPFKARQRGLVDVQNLVVKTAYPFGFFEKSRRLPMPMHQRFWCFPKRVDVDNLVATLVARFGEALAGRSGSGDDFFALRPFRAGDDVRRVFWRRSARSGRWVVKETEALAGRALILELALRPKAHSAHVEHALAVLGSLSEDLLDAGLSIGVRSAGTWVRPGNGDRQRRDILLALAKLDAAAPMPRLASDAATMRIALVGPISEALPGVATSVTIAPTEPDKEAAA